MPFMPGMGPDEAPPEWNRQQVGGLGGLAQGLRLAGGIFSPSVFRTVAEEDQRREQQAQTQRLMEIQQTVRGIEAGAIPPEAGQMRLEQLGFKAPVGPGPEAQAKVERQQQQLAMREAVSKLPPDASFEDRLIAMAPHMPPELQLQAYSKVEGRREELKLREQQMQQIHEQRLQGLTNQQQRDAETARHNTALEDLRAESNNLRRVGGALGRGAGGQAKPPTGYRWTDAGELEPIPGGPKDTSGAASGKPLPPSAAKIIFENQQNLRKAQIARDLLEGKTVNDQQGDPNAVGMKGYTPEAILQRTDPGGVPTRAAVANLGSMIIHDRSGAAVTAAEYPRLRPFIPLVTDKPEVAKKKLAQFVSEYKSIQQEMTDFYRESGYKVPTDALVSPKVENAAPAAGGGWSIQKVE